jgi:hypothetical protein
MQDTSHSLNKKLFLFASFLFASFLFASFYLPNISDLPNERMEGKLKP